MRELDSSQLGGGGIHAAAADGQWARNGTVYRARDRAVLRSLLVRVPSWLLLTVGYCAAAAFVVVRALHGQATVGNVVLTMSLAGTVNAALGSLLWSYGQMARTTRAVSRSSRPSSASER